MKTTDLIDALSQDPAAPRRAAAPRLAVAALAGAGLSVAALVAWLGMPQMSGAVQTSWFWMKSGYTIALALTAGFAAARLARPGGRVGAIWLLAGVAAAWLAMLAMHETMRAPLTDQAQIWLGVSWSECPLRILVLALPTFLATLGALRQMAPTRLALAGAAAGLFAGAVGATVYGLYCRETTAAFTLVWYSLGIAVTAGVGALVGRRLLRW